MKPRRKCRRCSAGAKRARRPRGGAAQTSAPRGISVRRRTRRPQPRRPSSRSRADDPPDERDRAPPLLPPLPTPQKQARLQQTRLPRRWTSPRRTGAARRHRPRLLLRRQPARRPTRTRAAAVARHRQARATARKGRPRWETCISRSHLRVSRRRPQRSHSALAPRKRRFMSWRSSSLVGRRALGRGRRHEHVVT